MYTSIFSMHINTPLPPNRDFPVHWISLKFIKQHFPSIKLIFLIFHEEGFPSFNVFRLFFNLIIGNLFSTQAFPWTYFWSLGKPTPQQRNFCRFELWRVIKMENLFLLNRYRFQIGTNSKILSQPHVCMTFKVFYLFFMSEHFFLRPLVRSIKPKVARAFLFKRTFVSSKAFLLTWPKPLKRLFSFWKHTQVAQDVF